jgi:hypothetical protein
MICMVIFGWLANLSNITKKNCNSKGEKMRKRISFLLSIILIFVFAVPNAYANTNVPKDILHIIKTSEQYKSLKKHEQVKINKKDILNYEVDTNNPNIGVISVLIDGSKEEQRGKALVATVDNEKKEILLWQIIETYDENETMVLTIREFSGKGNQNFKFNKDSTFETDGKSFSNLTDYKKHIKEKKDKNKRYQNSNEVIALGTTCETTTSYVCGPVTSVVSSVVCALAGFTTWGVAWFSCTVVSSVVSTWVCNEVSNTVCTYTPSPTCPSPYLWSESERMCTWWGI